jgi:ribosomal peptide maturation radical SAM protein 1
MKLALVAMPWSIAERPSAALGALSAHVRRRRPDVEVVSHYEYVRVALEVGFAAYGAVANEFYMGDLLYMPLLYPEKRSGVRDAFVDWIRAQGRAPAELGGASWDDVLARLEAGFRRRLDTLAGELAGQDVIGMTTCFGQLFPNLALALRLRELGSAARIVLGGSTVSARVGPSLLDEYPYIDHVIQGEGERPLVGYLDALARGDDPGAVPGVVARGGAVAALSETPDLDELPLPDFAPYVELARRHGFDWRLPIEGSRGCWWDRTRRHGNPKATCYFCNLNVQWGGYREKSVGRLVDEVKTLTETNHNTQIYFLDNIIRHEGVEELAAGLAALGKDLEFFYEMRANVSPYELLVLWEAGLRGLQVGIEGLSTDYLRRIGKGTTAIQNLQIMKTCAELGVSNASANLITTFPGSTAAEVAETVRVIRRFALAYEPCNLARFALGVDSTVDRRREEFGIRNVRNKDWLRAGLPEEVWRRLQLLDLSFDDGGGTADWTPVAEACADWRRLWDEGHRPLLSYLDGGTFVKVIDRRAGKGAPQPVRLLEARAREIYLDCLEIRSFEQIAVRHHLGAADQRRRLRAFLEKLVGWGLMFGENDRYLSLALAPSPQAAARRIRAAHAAEPREQGEQKPRLRVLP